MTTLPATVTESNLTLSALRRPSLIVVWAWTLLTIGVPLLIGSANLDSSSLAVLGFKFSLDALDEILNRRYLIGYSLLFVPRFIFLLLLIKYLFGNQPIRCPESGLTWTPILFISALLGVHYVTLAILIQAGIYFALRNEIKITRWMLTALIGFLILIALHIPRGTLLLLVFPLLLRFQKASFSVRMLFFAGVVLLTYSATVIKFGTTDPIVLLNVVNRISSYTQYIFPALFPSISFDAARPLSLDLLASAPLVRNLYAPLDESKIFYFVTGGSIGGLAIGPELRAYSYWSGSNWAAFVDICIFYLVLSLAIRFTVFLMPRARAALVAALPMVILLDTINSAYLYLQCALVYCFLEYLYSVRMVFLDVPVIKNEKN